MNQEAYDNHVRILREELVCALGCTEPIAVAYAAALARAALPVEPERLHVACSGNIIKNVKSVTVPNSGGMRGIEAAATLGAVGGDPTRDLEVLQSVGVDDIDRTRELVNAGFCDVELAEDVPNLYVRVVATGAGHTAVACIEERHTNVVELTLDGRPTTAAGKSASGEKSEATGSGADRSKLSLRSIWDFAHEVRLEDVDELITNQIERTRPSPARASPTAGAPTSAARSSRAAPTTSAARRAPRRPPAPTPA